MLRNTRTVLKRQYVVFPPHDTIRFPFPFSAPKSYASLLSNLNSLSLFCWLRALSGSRSGGGGAPRAESPPAQGAACPPGHRLASRGSEREKVKPIVYPLAAGPAARSEGGHCSTLPRQCCHMGNRRISNLQPTKSKANIPA